MYISRVMWYNTSMTTPTTHTYDWHKEPQTSFLNWLLIAIVSGTRESDNELFETLSTLTDKFTSVELDIRINNVAVDAKAFLDRLEQAMDSAVAFEAKKIIEDMPRLNELYDTLHTIETRFRAEVIKTAREAGIELGEDEFR